MRLVIAAERTERMFLFAVADEDAPDWDAQSCDNPAPLLVPVAANSELPALPLRGRIFIGPVGIAESPWWLETSQGRFIVERHTYDPQVQRACDFAREHEGELVIVSGQWVLPGSAWPDGQWGNWPYSLADEQPVIWPSDVRLASSLLLPANRTVTLDSLQDDVSQDGSSAGDGSLLLENSSSGSGDGSFLVAGGQDAAPVQAVPTPLLDPSGQPVQADVALTPSGQLQVVRWKPAQSLNQMLTAARAQLDILEGQQNVVDSATRHVYAPFVGSLDPFAEAEATYRSLAGQPDTDSNRYKAVDLLLSLGLWYPDWPANRRPDSGDLFARIPSLSGELASSAKDLAKTADSGLTTGLYVIGGALGVLALVEILK